MRLISTLLLFLALHSATMYAQSADAIFANTQTVNGRHYALNVQHERVDDVETIPMYLYTADSKTQEVQVHEVTWSEGITTTRWEKKRDPNCASRNPDDCVIKCLVENKPPITVTRITFDSKASESAKPLAVKGEITLPNAETSYYGKLICCEVVHPEQCNADFVARLQAALRDAGCKSGKDSTQLNDSIVAALFKYQQKKKLPVGSLNVQSLKALGVI